MALSYQTAEADLKRIFALAEIDVANGNMPAVSATAQEAAREMFDSGTQSIREALLGCALARLQDQTIDITLPYINHGPTAFNGRTLDEQVVNPFLKAAKIPSSKGRIWPVSGEASDLTPRPARDFATKRHFRQCFRTSTS